MSEFQFDTIRILDNGDEIYHRRAPSRETSLPRGVTRRADQILDAEGVEIRSDAPVVREFMARLGISSLEGLRLSPVRQYFESLQEAERGAGEGDIVRVRESLQGAREAATHARLTFSEARAEGILLRCAIRELSLLQEEASARAEEGNVAAVEDAVNAARDVLIRLNVAWENWESSGLPFPPSQADAIRQRTYRQAIPQALQRAEAHAAHGNVEGARAGLEITRQYFSRLHETIPEETARRMQEIERRALTQAVELNFTSAAESSRQGDVRQTLIDLVRARDASRLAGSAWTEAQERRAQTLEREAHAHAVVLGLARLEHEITAAEASHREADVGAIRAELQAIRDHALISGVPLTPSQEIQMRDLLQRASQADIEWRFGQAEGSAADGKVDDTLVPLNAGRELAAQAGLAFDEARAGRALRLALQNGIELSFQNARCFALVHDEENTRLHLTHAREYASRLSLPFDETRTQGILTLLERSRRRRPSEEDDRECNGFRLGELWEEGAEGGISE